MTEFITKSLATKMITFIIKELELEVSEKITLIASPGLMLKALSKIQEPYKFNIDIYNLDHIQSFRKCVLSSLMALPHHACIEEVWRVMKDVPEMDVEIKGKIQAYIENKFKEKFSVTWGSVSTVVDKCNIAESRYHMETAAFNSVFEALCLPCEKSYLFAKNSYEVLKTDYT